MIEYLYMANFRSWEKVKIKFSPGVNVIVGLSGKGKSNIIKAFRWIYRNQTPAGGRHRSVWGGDTKVRIKNTTHLISRIQGNGRNLYRLDGEDFNAVAKSSVPPEIEQALNFSDVSLQLQKEPFFLFNNTSGKVAQYINKLVKLDIINTLYKRNQADITETTNYLKFAEEELKKFQDDKKDLKWVDQAEADLKVIVTLSEKVEKIKQEKIVLSITLNSISVTQQKLKKYDGFYKMGEDLKVIQIKEVEYKKLEDEHNTLELLLNKMDNSRSRVSKLTATALQCKKDFDKAMPNICPLCNEKRRGKNV